MGPIQDIDLLALDKNAVQYKVLEPGPAAYVRAYKDLSNSSGMSQVSIAIAIHINVIIWLIENNNYEI